MKAQFVKVKGMGLCLLISDFNPAQVAAMGVDGDTHIRSNNSPFTDLNEIAECIRYGKKINAIKEVRSQTGWGLKDAKEYMDKYSFSEEAQIREADRFIREHSYVMEGDFIDDNEMELT